MPTMRKIKSVPVNCKQRYAFVGDGECESWYIQMLKRNERTINVNLEPKIPQRKKLSEQFEMVLDLSIYYDNVFWIIDFDVINSETRSSKKGDKTVLQECREYFDKIGSDNKKIKIIINNPCLEYWFLLHFEFTSKYLENCEKVVSYFKKYKDLSDYEKSKKYYTKEGCDIYLRLKQYLNNAITNSNKLAPFDFENPHSGLSQMQVLFESENLKQINAEVKVFCEPKK